MTTSRTFMSPIINPLVVAGVRFMLPFLFRHLSGRLSIHISQQDLARLKAYQNQRMLLLPNHPTGEEPLVLFEIARRLNEVFHFVAAREVFDWEHGFRGWLLRRVGAYSVIRGAADRESFMTSKKILMEGLHRLVIFIEGEISRGNETLIPFESGVIQLAFWAQEGLVKEAVKQARSGSEPAAVAAPPIYIAPVGIKYFFAPGFEPTVEQALQRLEVAVGLKRNARQDWYERIGAVGEVVLRVQEALHHVTPHPEASFTERVETIRGRMLQKMELFLDITPPSGASTLNRLREIRNTMDHLIHTYEDPTDLTDYQRRMVEHLRIALSEFYTDLDRVVYFLTYDEAYLRESRSPERFIEMVCRLEREVYGEVRLRHPRVAVLKVGEVRNLQACYPDYERDKKGYVRHLAAELEEDMRAMILGMPNPFHHLQ